MHSNFVVKFTCGFFGDGVDHGEQWTVDFDLHGQRELQGFSFHQHFTIKSEWLVQCDMLMKIFVFVFVFFFGWFFYELEETTVYSAIINNRWWLIQLLCFLQCLFPPFFSIKVLFLLTGGGVYEHWSFLFGRSKWKINNIVSSNWNLEVN